MPLWTNISLIWLILPIILFVPYYFCVADIVKSILSSLFYFFLHKNVINFMIITILQVMNAKAEKS